MKARSPGGFSRRSSGLTRLRSPDALVLLSCVAAVILLLPLRDLPGVFSPLAFAATLVLFTAPGLLLSHWLLRDAMSGTALVPMGFAISTGIFGLLGVPALILHLSTENYLLAAGTLLAAFLAVAVWRTVRPKELTVESSPERDAPYGPPAGWLWAPFALLCGVLAFVGTRRVPSSYDDVWVYLSWVKDFANSERLALVDPYFGERIAEFSRAKVNGWLLEQAALSRVSGLDTIELVLRYLTPTLVVVALLMVYALALAIVKSERAAVLTASVYVLLLGRGSRSSVRTTGHRAVHARLRGDARGGQPAPARSLDENDSPRARDVERRPRTTLTLAVYGQVSGGRAVLRRYQRYASQGARIHGLHNGELETHPQAR